MPAEWLLAIGRVLKNLLVGGDITTHVSYDQKSKSYKISGDHVNAGNTTNIGTQVNNYIVVPAVAEDRLVDMLKVNAFEKDIIFLEDNSKKILGDFQQFKQGKEVKELVDFFESKLPFMDLILMETGLYIDYLQTTGNLEESQKQKTDVLNRYPGRGKNIVNLASAGHFATHIKPLYETMCQEEGFSRSDFLDEYEKIVTDTPFAVFVHSGMTLEKVIDQVEQRLSKGLKYHLDDDSINIHGFGSNVKKVEEAQQILQKKYQVSSHIYTKTIPIAHVKVFHKKAVKV